LTRLRSAPASIARFNAAMASTTTAAERAGVAFVLSGRRVEAMGRLFMRYIRTMQLARAGTVAVAGAVGLLRGALAALGGPIGLAITAITLLLSVWLTKARDVNTALEEHERVLRDVQQAYVDAKGKVEDWAEKLKEVSAIEITLNTKDLRRQLDEIRG